MRALVIFAALAACQIEHPSDAFVCVNQADCTGGRTCTNGYCIVSSSGCPSGCTSCDLTAKTCAIDTSGNGGNTVTCPPGYSCNITCGANGCRNVDCNGGTTCTLTCSGSKSCDDVKCSGKCTILCSGSQSCANLDCRDSCACDVTCSGAGSCNNLDCPNNCGTQTSCSSTSASCHSC